MISRGQCESSDVTGCLPTTGQQSHCATDLEGQGGETRAGFGMDIRGKGITRETGL